MSKDTKRRATLAKRTLKAHATRLYGKGSVEPEETVISDLLTDLRHLCDSLKLDFAELNKNAQTHYSAELRAEKRGIYLLTRVEGSPMFRLQGPDNTDAYVDTLDAAFDALSKLNIVSVEITATEVR
jgi:hypothetical protein